ncbi:MAG: hypothetical protein K8I02_00595, partial [Candidatus Methylomirabilis sp.]|nr:hypothetical protein [Deltaproteobacteria bacterium]
TATVKGAVEATAETGDAVVAALVGDVRATAILGGVTAAGRRVDAVAAETASLMAGEKVTIGAPEVELVGAGSILLSSPLITSLAQWVFTALGFIWNAAADWTVNVVGVLSQSAGTMFLNAALKMKLYALQELEMETDLLKVSARRVELVADDPAAPLDITTTGTARLTSTDGDIEFKTPKGAFKVNGKVVPEA